VSEVEGDRVDHHETHARAAAGGEVFEPLDHGEQLGQVVAAEDVDPGQNPLHAKGQSRRFGGGGISS